MKTSHHRMTHFVLDLFPATQAFGARWLLVASIVLLLIPARADAQTITGLSVTEATVGTEFQITGTGFGTSPKVFLAQDGVKAKKTKLKVLSATDSSLDVEVLKAFRDTFTILVQPKGGTAVESTETLDVVAPTIMELGEEGVLTPGETATMTVAYAGTGKAKAYVAGLRAKVLSIEPIAPPEGGGEAEDLATVSIQVPKKAPNGTWAVQFSNPIGIGTSLDGLVVTGSSAKIGKDKVTAMLDGAKPFKAKSKKIEVQTSLMGPTTILATAGGSKKGRTYTIVLPFVYGSDQPPQLSTETPAMIHYLDLGSGEELMTAEDDFGILVSAVEDGRVAGTFTGLLHPLDGPGDPREVTGDFIYDGVFSLEDGGGDTNTVLEEGEEAPAIEVQVLSVSGATGPIGNFQPGDSVAVHFRLAKDDGTSWHLSEMSLGRSMISGPTTNYQRVITQQTDVRQVAVDNGDGTYTYTFPPLPDVYEAPYNDTDSFGPDDGELTGEALLDGTYTLALWFEWSYTVGASGYDEVGTSTVNFLLGATPQALQAREVVTTANCNQCHSELQAHGGMRRTNDMCVLCHTAGAEDRNTGAAGGSPGVTIEWNVMIHKIHTGSSLPSVLGMTTDVSGARDYTVDPVPYQVVGFGDSIHDYSSVVFPAWPNLVAPMPRDSGYEALTGEAQDQEDAQRSGPTNCNLCHGDPDGMEGPLEAPAQGDLIYTKLRRNTCGSCHDDWIFDQLYTSNLQTMPAQSDDANCTLCHDASGDPLAVMDAHLHPLLDPGFATGVNFDLLDVLEGGTNDGDGSLDPGEKLAVMFTVQDDMGIDIEPADLDRHNLVVSGPSENLNILVGEQSIPSEVLTGPQPFTMLVPMRVYYERIGMATDGDDAFTTAFTPVWNVGSQGTEVRENTGLAGGSTVLSAAVTAPVNFIDVDDATGFLRDDYVVIDHGSEDAEILRIQLVMGNRLWFSSPQTPAYAPGPVKDHDAGIAVEEAVLTDPFTEGVEYDIDTETGTITELGGAWTDGNEIVVTYTSDYVIPDTYPLALNAGPDLTERDGGWAGKSIVDGTYSIGMWGHQDRDFMAFGETTEYTDGGAGVRREFLVGNASELMPWDNISAASNCYSCHVDIQFHGNNRRGWDSCLMCHGTAASGDRPIYVAANAPATDGVTIAFREMLHKIHRGADLAQAETYEVVGFGPVYPNNFSVHTYEEVHFPAMPSGVMECTKCHGADSEAWMEPSDRAHPTEASEPTAEWTTVCNSCHDSASEQAHIESQTSPITGAESCAICHAPGQLWSVDRMHTVR